MDAGQRLGAGRHVYRQPPLGHETAGQVNQAQHRAVGIDQTPDLQPVYDWFIENEDNYVITASNADSITRMNAGEFSMIAVWEDHIGGLIRRGEVADRFKVYVPDFGMNGDGNVVAIPQNAANPAPAMVLAE